MILYGMVRTKSGNKEPIRMSGYTGPSDLGRAYQTVKAQVPYTRTILFLVPKQESKQ